MKIAANDVRQQRFGLKFRGFDIEEVNNYLELIANELEELIRTNDDLKNELNKRGQEIEEYKRVENDFRRLIASAQDFRKDAIEKANQESQLITKQAEIKALEILRTAEEEVSRIGKNIADLKTQRLQLEIQLKAVIESHLKLLDMTKQEEEKI